MRRRRAESREFAPDARYNSVLVTHLTNIIMSRGKKSTAQRTVYGALVHQHSNLQRALLQQ